MERGKLDLAVRLLEEMKIRAEARDFESVQLINRNFTSVEIKLDLDYAEGLLE